MRIYSQSPRRNLLNIIIVSRAQFWKPVTVARGPKNTIWVADSNRIRILALNTSFNIAFTNYPPTKV